MQTEAMREKLFTIRMTDEERERAERLAQHHGLNVAGLIRMLLRKEEREIGATEPVKASAAPKKPAAKAKR